MATTNGDLIRWFIQTKITLSIENIVSSCVCMYSVYIAVSYTHLDVYKRQTIPSSGYFVKIVRKYRVRTITTKLYILNSLIQYVFRRLSSEALKSVLSESGTTMVA